jgi:hypothetical protein
LFQPRWLEIVLGFQCRVQFQIDDDLAHGFLPVTDRVGLESVRRGPAVTRASDLAWIGFVFILVSNPAEAATVQRLGAPLLPSVEETGRVEAYDQDGTLRWTSRWTMVSEVESGQPIVRMSEEGEGRHSSFDGEIAWRTDTVWAAGDSFAPLHSEKTFTDAGGVRLVRERTEFDHSAGRISFGHQDLTTGESRSETFEMPFDTLSVEGIAAALRGFPFGDDVAVQAHLFTPEPQLYEVTLRPRGRETLTTRDGQIEAYKVEIVPSLGLLTLFRFFLPEAYFWFSVEPPYTWLRYEGPENGRGTPKITMERVP